MFKGEYKWQHDYVRLAINTGFCFERHKSDNFDKNKINSLDIDRIIEERDVSTIENFIPSITKFVLDPEQAQILDDSFVKTFRLSQLSLQYLLFCKKYLDNTLKILKEDIKKVKEENQELSLFVDDLKLHISNLMKEIDDKPTFKCTQCNKIFSSEDFLNSHIKRRHSTPVREAETDKLQMEIKELKGRLNNAEKLIQKEQNEFDANATNPKEADLKKIEELQQKFEDLRLQVQSELKVLQTQHNFQEKYEKLFEKMALRGAGKIEGRGDLGERRESTTQTDLDRESGIELSAIPSRFEEKNKENIPEISNTQKQMTEIGEALETKVTCSLQKIESQMQSFWTKLNEMEMHRKDDLDQGFNRQKPKPMVRSRSKQALKPVEIGNEEVVQNKEKGLMYQGITNSILKDDDTEETDNSSQKNFQNKEPVKVAKEVSPVRIVEAQTKKLLNVKKSEKIEAEIHRREIEDHETDATMSETVATESDISSDPSAANEESMKVVKPMPIPRKRPHSGVRKNNDKNVIDEELLEHFKLEVEKIIMGRLQDLGVSPEWKGLPTRSFQRAIEIVNHQASLMKKGHPNFDSMSSQIERNVVKKLEETTSKQPLPRKVMKPKVKKETKKVIARKKAPSPKIEIKNRKMYETDSDSEIKPTQVKENLKKIAAPYSAVIEELKTVTSKIDSSDKSDVQVVVKTEEQTKGVLKSYPSVGSLTKKKVLFNLESDDKRDLSKDGGSTTSIASSVLDGTPRKEDKKKDKEKDIEDLSDFDFSDM